MSPSSTEAARMPQATGRTRAVVALLTCVTMAAFAANSLLARLAFQTTTIDAASFTAIRLVSGALVLFAVLRSQGGRSRPLGRDWLSALLLFIYAAAFSFAYRGISTGAGALVLFACAQLLMISYGLYQGERTSLAGLAMALAGLAAFLAPSTSSPPLGSAALMALAGFAWGGFSVRGRSGGDPVAGTAGSFILAVPLALALMLLHYQSLHVDRAGAIYALLSGGLTSGIGYAIWYWVRVRMAVISTAVVQLSVPVLSAAFGAALLHETITIRSAAAALVVLGGIGLVILSSQRR